MPFISASVISPYNSIRGGAEGGLVPLLLDLYPNAATAYSLRKLRTAYSGPAIEARKTVGGETFVQDIGFVDNELDTASLLTFANGGDVFVAKWYDQSGGEGNDVVQVSESAQPKIVSLGNLVEQNGKPSIYFDGNVNLQSLNNTNYGTSSRSLFLSSRLDGETNGMVSLTDADTGIGSVWINTYELATRTRVYIWVSSTELPSTYLSLLSNIYTSGQLFEGNSMWLNGNDVVRTSGADGPINTAIGKLTVGANGFGFNATVFISEFIAYQSDQSANRAAIENNINSNYNIYWDGSQTGLLDDYPNASAAYSLRALNSAYTGPAIKVRRSSDNEEQDINLLYDGTLHTASLLSFVGAGDAYVSKWYDQSGNGNNDALQNSASKQPQIVSSGSVINENGNISVKFNGTTDWVKNQLSVGPTVTSFAVSKIVDEFDFNFIYDSFGAGGRIRLGLRNSKVYFADNGEGTFAEATTPSNGLQNLFFTKHTNSDVSISVNNDTLKTLASTNFYANSQYWVIGARNDGADHFLEGTIQELILYPSDQTANRAGIESNINNHYTIY